MRVADIPFGIWISCRFPLTWFDEWILIWCWEILSFLWVCWLKKTSFTKLIVWIKWIWSSIAGRQFGDPHRLLKALHIRQFFKFIFSPYSSKWHRNDIQNYLQISQIMYRLNHQICKKLDGFQITQFCFYCYSYVIT